MPPEFSDEEELSDGDDEEFVMENLRELLEEEIEEDRDKDEDDDEDDDIIFVDEVKKQPQPEDEPEIDIVIRKHGPMDDNDLATYQNRIRELNINSMDIKPDYTTTWNVKSQEDRDSEKPWKVETLTWDRLYPYQQEGVRWMQKRTDQRSGGILADEMGLGKTVQAIVYLRSISETRRSHMQVTGLDKCLIVCPVSVLNQWISALHEWFPTVRVILLHRDCSTHKAHNYVQRAIKEVRQSTNPVIMLTTYETFTKNCDKGIGELLWQVVLLDEGHHIRNEKTKCAIAMKVLRCPHRFILSGTPFQNNLKEFWKLIDFVDPGRFSTWTNFNKNFVKVIEAGSNLGCSPHAAAKAYACLVMVHRAVKSIILQRFQKDHKDELLLPDKNETIIRCDITDHQRNIYQNYLQSSEVENILSQKAESLYGIQKLCNICNHPGIFLKSDPNTFEVEESGKVKMTFELLERWFKEDSTNKVIIFTSRKTVVAMFVRFLEERQISCVSFTGDDSSGQRSRVIKKFETDPTVKVFVITTRAGGLGLNLVAANKMIIFDPDWNPNVDNQAADRIYRVGQMKNVNIVRLLSRGTIEDMIYRKQQQKKERGKQVLHDVDGAQKTIPNNSIFDLFRLMPAGYHDPVFKDEEELQTESADNTETADVTGEAEKSEKKKNKKNKLAGFENRALLLAILDEEKLTAMRNHSIAVANAVVMTRQDRLDLQETVDRAVGSIVHRSGRLSANWIGEMHKRLGFNQKELHREYHIKEDETDPYWHTVHKNGYTHRFNEKNDKDDLEAYVKVALCWAEMLSGSPDGVSEDLLMKLPFVKPDYKTNPVRHYFLQEILHEVGKYNEISGKWEAVPKYRNLKFDLLRQPGSSTGSTASSSRPGNSLSDGERRNRQLEDAVRSNNSRVGSHSKEKLKQSDGSISKKCSSSTDHRHHPSSSVQKASVSDRSHSTTHPTRIRASGNGESFSSSRPKVLPSSNYETEKRKRPSDDAESKKSTSSTDRRREALPVYGAVQSTSKSHSSSSRTDSDYALKKREGHSIDTSRSMNKKTSSRQPSQSSSSIQKTMIPVESHSSDRQPPKRVSQYGEYSSSRSESSIKRDSDSKMKKYQPEENACSASKIESRQLSQSSSSSQKTTIPVESHSSDRQPPKRVSQYGEYSSSRSESSIQRDSDSKKKKYQPEEDACSASKMESGQQSQSSSSIQKTMIPVESHSSDRQPPKRVSQYGEYSSSRSESSIQRDSDSKKKKYQPEEDACSASKIESRQPSQSSSSSQKTMIPVESHSSDRQPPKRVSQYGEYSSSRSESSIQRDSDSKKKKYQPEEDACSASKMESGQQSQSSSSIQKTMIPVESHSSDRQPPKRVSQYGEYSSSRSESSIQRDSDSKMKKYQPEEDACSASKKESGQQSQSSSSIQKTMIPVESHSSDRQPPKRVSQYGEYSSSRSESSIQRDSDSKKKKYQPEEDACSASKMESGQQSQSSSSIQKTMIPVESHSSDRQPPKRVSQYGEYSSSRSESSIQRDSDSKMKKYQPEEDACSASKIESRQPSHSSSSSQKTMIPVESHSSDRQPPKRVSQYGEYSSSRSESSIQRDSDSKKKKYQPEEDACSASKMESGQQSQSSSSIQKTMIPVESHSSDRQPPKRVSQYGEYSSSRSESSIQRDSDSKMKKYQPEEDACSASKKESGQQSQSSSSIQKTMIPVESHSSDRQPPKRVSQYGEYSSSRSESSIQRDSDSKKKKYQPEEDACSASKMESGQQSQSSSSIQKTMIPVESHSSDRQPPKRVSQYGEYSSSRSESSIQRDSDSKKKKYQPEEDACSASKMESGQQSQSSSSIQKTMIPVESHSSDRQPPKRVSQYGEYSSSRSESSIQRDSDSKKKKYQPEEDACSASKMESGQQSQSSSSIQKTMIPVESHSSDRQPPKRVSQYGEYSSSRSESSMQRDSDSKKKKYQPEEDACSASKMESGQQSQSSSSIQKTMIPVESHSSDRQPPKRVSQYGEYSSSRSESSIQRDSDSKKKKYQPEEDACSASKMESGQQSQSSSSIQKTMIPVESHSSDRQPPKRVSQYGEYSSSRSESSIQRDSDSKKKKYQPEEDACSASKMESGQQSQSSSSIQNMAMPVESDLPYQQPLTRVLGSGESSMSRYNTSLLSDDSQPEIKNNSYETSQPSSSVQKTAVPVKSKSDKLISDVILGNEDFSLSRSDQLLSKNHLVDTESKNSSCEQRQSISFVQNTTMPVETDMLDQKPSIESLRSGNIFSSRSVTCSSSYYQTEKRKRDFDSLVHMASKKSKPATDENGGQLEPSSVITLEEVPSMQRASADAAHSNSKNSCPTSREMSQLTSSVQETMMPVETDMLDQKPSYMPRTLSKCGVAATGEFYYSNRVPCDNTNITKTEIAEMRARQQLEASSSSGNKMNAAKPQPTTQKPPLSKPADSEVIDLSDDEEHRALTRRFMSTLSKLKTEHEKPANSSSVKKIVTSPAANSNTVSTPSIQPSTVHCSASDDVRPTTNGPQVLSATHVDATESSLFPNGPHDPLTCAQPQDTRGGTSALESLVSHNGNDTAPSLVAVVPPSQPSKKRSIGAVDSGEKEVESSVDNRPQISLNSDSSHGPSDNSVVEPTRDDSSVTRSAKKYPKMRRAVDRDISAQDLIITTKRERRSTASSGPVATTPGSATNRRSATIPRSATNRRSATTPRSATNRRSATTPRSATSTRQTAVPKATRKHKKAQKRR